jgi:predicted aspartyl protease
MRDANGARWIGRLCVLTLCLQPHQAALAHCQIGQVAEIPVEFVSNEVLAHGQIDGQPITVVVDTGSAQSMIWRAAAARLGLPLAAGPTAVHLYGLGGESRLEQTVIKELRFGDFAVKDLRIPAAGDVRTDFDLLLGDDFWSVSSLEFDLKHHVIRMLNPNGCKPAELPYWAKTYSMADLIASPRDTRMIEVEVQLNGHALRAQIDSGAARSLVSKSLADAIGVSYQGASEQIHGIGTHSLESWIATFQRFTLGDETINNVQLRVAKMSQNSKEERLGSRLPVNVVKMPDMILGADFLQAHRVLIDNSTRKIVFTYEGGPVFQTLEPNQLNASTPGTAAEPPAGGAAKAAAPPPPDSHDH